MAMQQSHYEINVSKHGCHLFATAERSATTRAQAAQIVQVFRDKFPETEGYKISCTLVHCSGEPVNL